jgi:competence protein ComEA
MNRYLVASILPLALLSNMSMAAVQSHHTRAHVHHAAATIRVNINTANSHQLTTLKGIGAKRADAIVAYRKSHGPFTTVQALSAVKGVGTKKVAAIEKQGLAFTTTAD